MADPVSLLVVCLGNICRSPMAEGALRARLQATVPGRVVVDSAGTGDWHVGHPPDRRAVRTARGHGVDISQLRARQIEPADYSRFDWLLCADLQNLRDVRARRPAGATAGIELLTAWAGVGHLGDDGAVPDPYTGDLDDFESVWAIVDEVALSVAARLDRMRDPGESGRSRTG